MALQREHLLWFIRRVVGWLVQYFNNLSKNLGFFRTFCSAVFTVLAIFPRGCKTAATTPAIVSMHNQVCSKSLAPSGQECQLQLLHRGSRLRPLTLYSPLLLPQCERPDFLPCSSELYISLSTPTFLGHPLHYRIAKSPGVDQRRLTKGGRLPEALRYRTNGPGSGPFGAHSQCTRSFLPLLVSRQPTWRIGTFR